MDSHDDFRFADTGLMQQRYPDMEVVPVTTDQIVDGVALDMVRNGVCASLTIPERMALYLKGRPENCDIDLAGVMTWPMNYVGGVSRESPNIDIRTISYWIAYLREVQEGGGTFADKLGEQFFDVPDELCGVEEGSVYNPISGKWEDVYDEKVSLDIGDIGGLLIVCSIMFAFIFLAKSWSDIGDHRLLRKVWKAADSDGSATLGFKELANVLIALGITEQKATKDKKKLDVEDMAYSVYNQHVDIDTLEMKYDDFAHFWEAL